MSLMRRESMDCMQQVRNKDFARPFQVGRSKLVSTLVRVALLLRIDSRASDRNGWITMNEDEDLVLNAKAIGLAVGGAALAGLLFVLTRRDEKPAPAGEAPVTESFADVARDAAKQARTHRESAEDAVTARTEPLADAIASAKLDSEDAERNLKAAAWDAQERARIAESKLRAASSKVAGDAAHIASRVGAEARHIAGEGKDRIAHLRRPDEADAEMERLRSELEALREEIAGKAKPERRDILGVSKKLAGKKVGPLPEGVAGEAANAALEHLEKSLKTKAPLLLAARNKAQALEILQREMGPVLRDSAMLALSTAVGGAERASQKAASAPADIKQRFRQSAESAAEGADDIEARLRAAREEASAEALKAREEAEAAARAARAEADRLKAELEAQLEELKQASASNGKHTLWSRHAAEQDSVPAPEPEFATTVERDEEHTGKRGVPGLLWGGAGVGLAIYALMDPERRDAMLKLANEASVQLQELVRDLQGYDDEF
jgi:hypothetical protein